MRGVSAEVAFAYGVAGGTLAELLGLFVLRRQAPGKLPEWVISPFYWLVTVAMILAGGALASAYVSSDIRLTPLLAINVGASAPLIIGTLTGQAPQVSPGKVD